MIIRKVIIKIGISFLIVLDLFLLTCVTDTPSGPKTNSQDITISLVRVGITDAEYKGEDLNLIIEFSDSIMVKLGTNFNIHSLNAYIYHTDEIITNATVESLTIPLYWQSRSGLPFDSSIQKSFDSIYVQAGLDESNVVKVIIENLPPRVTSFRVGDSSYILPSHIIDVIVYKYYVTDSSDSMIPMSVSAIDPDGLPRYSWGIRSGSDGVDLNKYLISNKTTAKYIVREGSYRDMVSAIITDNDKQIHLKVNVIRMDGTEVQIDSVRFNDTTFNDVKLTYEIIYSNLSDITNIRVYPHTGNPTIEWTAKNGTVSMKTTNGLSVTYTCTLSTVSDTLMIDTILLMDSIHLVMTNSTKDASSEKSICIYKKPLNLRPVFDSLRIDTITYTTNFNYTADAGSTIVFKAFAHDPEGRAAGGTITYSWSGSTTGSLSGAVADSVFYIAATNKVYKDTIVVVASDSLNFKTSKTIIVSCNNTPVIYRINVGAKSFYPAWNSDTIYTVASDSSKTPGNFVVQAYARDIDTVSGDLMSFEIHYKNNFIMNTVALSDSIYYISADSTYVDTMMFIVFDTYSRSDTQRVVLSFTK